MTNTTAATPGIVRSANVVSPPRGTVPARTTRVKKASPAVESPWIAGFL